MNTKAFRASWVMLLVVFSLSVASGLIMAFAAGFFLASEFEGYTDQGWEAFSASNPRAISFFLLEGTQMGLFMIALSVMAIAVTWFAYRKGERWAWYLFLFTNTLAMGGSLTTNLPTGDLGVIILVAVFLLTGYVALALGAKAILGRTSGSHPS